MRYKYDRETGRRCTTVELIEEESDPHIDPKAEKVQAPVPPPQQLGVRAEYWETDEREKVKAAEGIWRPRQKLWEIGYEDVIALGLEARVVGEDFAAS